jgi:hypothetical protein
VMMLRWNGAGGCCGCGWCRSWRAVEAILFPQGVADDMLDPHFAPAFSASGAKRDPDQFQQTSPDDKKLMDYRLTASSSVPGFDCWLL